MERTLVLIKPDAVQRSLTGEVIKRLEQTGLKMVGIKMIQINDELAEKHYAEHVEKPFYPGLKKFMMEGPVIAIAFQGLHAADTVRKIVGGTEPQGAAPGTIRGDFAHHSYSHADDKGIAIKNMIHASGDSEAAKHEVALWFSGDELYDYETVHERHVF